MNRPESTNLSVLMGAVAASLAVASALHLSGADKGGPGGNPTPAGIAEAVICVVLAGAAVMLIRRGGAARSLALGATGFAIAGFAYGLSQTASGGDLPDLLYHAIVLPILIATFVALLFVKRSSGETAGQVPGNPHRVRSR